MNKNIKEYRTSSGKKRYKFNVYAGKIKLQDNQKSFESVVLNQN